MRNLGHCSSGGGGGGGGCGSVLQWSLNSVTRSAALLTSPHLFTLPLVP
ncbi:hypothetical protein E2C01_097095 [Portunus trituberculatus]|uniref:Uncharacterized protein n=1 Tax=Portunus trituberculatus TaxID=210409 RepID=A0A5B7JXE5_PORTR|nr:hypothetical protein [Portunus trituberculatus]